MRTVLIRYTFLLFSLSVFAQKKIDRVLRTFNSETVPYTYIYEAEKLNDVVFLDTREKEEFDVSHLKNAIWVGYDSFSIDSMHTNVPNKKTPIIVYCSIGVRSEDIGEQLINNGYTNVKNLFGGIFEWKNNDCLLYDNQNNTTEKVHAYSKVWGKLLTKGIKVYGPQKP